MSQLRARAPLCIMAPLAAQSYTKRQVALTLVQAAVPKLDVTRNKGQATIPATDKVFFMGVLAGSLNWWYSMWCCSFILLVSRSIPAAVGDTDTTKSKERRPPAGGEGMEE